MTLARASQSTTSTESPHRSKLRKYQIKALTPVFHFGTFYSSNNNPITVNAYSQNREGQTSNASIKELGVFEHLIKVMDSADPFESFLRKVWTEKPYTAALTDHGEAFLQVVNYTLTTFHLVSRALAAVNPSDHERTYFCEEHLMYSTICWIRKYTKCQNEQ